MSCITRGKQAINKGFLRGENEASQSYCFLQVMLPMQNLLPTSRNGSTKGFYCREIGAIGMDGG